MTTPGEHRIERGLTAILAADVAGTLLTGSDRYHSLALGTLGLPKRLSKQRRGTCIAGAQRRRAGKP